MAGGRNGKACLRGKKSVSERSGTLCGTGEASPHHHTEAKETGRVLIGHSAGISTPVRVAMWMVAVLMVSTAALLEGLWSANF